MVKMRNMLVRLLYGYILSASTSYVLSWSCKSLVGQVYSRQNQSTTLRFDISSSLPSVNEARTYSIISYDSRIIGIIRYAFGMTMTDPAVGVNITGDVAGNVEVTLLNVQINQAGTYVIYSGFLEGTCSCLYVLGVPIIPTISKDKDPSVGENATITCSSTSTTFPTNHSLIMKYDWSLDGVQNPAAGRYTYSRNTLTVSGVVKEDSSKSFTCKATEVVSDGYESPWSKDEHLNVRYGPLIMEFTPAVTVYEQEENTPLPTVLCTADCNPACSFRWTKIETGAMLNNTASLQLGFLTRTEAGTYRCTATRAGSASATKDIIIIVIYPPKVTIRVWPMTVTNNHELKLFCDAKDRFPSTYNYRGFVHIYNGQVIPINSPAVLGTPRNSSLHILSAELQDMGTYICYINNGVGNETLDQMSSAEIEIKAQPVFVLGEKTVFGTIGESVLVFITFYSYPEFNNITITRSDGIIVANSSNKYKVTNVRTTIESSFYSSKVLINGTMIYFNIDNLTHDDFAVYVIVVSNDAGYSSTKITVSQKSLPLPPTQFSVSVFSSILLTFYWTSASNGGYTQSFIIQTSMEGTDHWDNRTLVQESDKEHMIYEGYYMVVVTDLSQGVYRCRITAMNSLGYAEAVYYNGSAEILYQSNGKENGNNGDQSALIVGLVLGTIIIALVICVLLFIIKLRKTSSNKAEACADKKEKPRTEKQTYANTMFSGHPADHHATFTEHRDKAEVDKPLKRLDEQYTSLDDRLKNDIDAYEAITPDTKIMV